MIEPVTAEEMVEGYSKMRLLPIFSSKRQAESIINDYSRASGFTVEDLCSPKRTRAIAHVRQDCMLAIRRSTSLGLSQIGQFFNRDHTTVMHGIRASEKRLAGYGK